MPNAKIGKVRIEFCSDGRFPNVTTTTNWDCPIIDGLARTPLMPRIKEGFEGSVFENMEEVPCLKSLEIFSPILTES